MFRLRDCVLIEGCNPSCEAVNEIVQLPIWQRAIDVAIQLRQFAIDVIRSEQHFEGSSSPDQTRQSSHGPPAGDQSRSNLPLRQDRFLPAGEAHVARECEFAADAGCASTYRADGDDGGST